MAAGREAQRLYENPSSLAYCLVRLSRLLFMAGETNEAEACAQRAVSLFLSIGAGPAALSYATLYLGAILALTDQPAEAMPALERADRLALESDRPDLAALCLNYLAMARVELGDAGGLETMRNSIALALAGGHHEASARGYCNLAELQLRMGRLDELDRTVREGLAFTRERGFWSHAYNLEVHRCLLLVRRGDFDGALEGLKALIADEETPGILYGYSVPWLGRLLARRGDPAADALVAEAWERAQRQRMLLGLAYAGIARAEWAWLVGDLDAARQVARVLLPRTEHPGAAPFRGELLRYLARAGLHAEPFADCPPAYAAGLVGEWRTAAAIWRRAGDPYETALELALERRAGRDRRRPGDPRPARRDARGRARAGGPEGARREGPARSQRGHAGEPGRADRAPAVRARPAARRDDQRRDRRAARALGADRRPPRGRDPGQARRALAPGRGGHGSLASGSATAKVQG